MRRRDLRNTTQPPARADSLPSSLARESRDFSRCGRDPSSESQPPRGEAVGIDLGLTTFAVLSNGEKVEAPKPLAKDLKRLRRLSRAHSRKRPGSHNREKAALRLARCHRRTGNIRKDFLHKFTTRISKDHATFVEDLT
jgi:transposase